MISWRCVEIGQWLTDRQFSELFAMAQAAPGPNIMFVALLGHFIAGAPGALVATELCPRLRGVAGSRTLSRGPLAHCDPGRPGAGDNRTYRCQRVDHHEGGRSRLGRLRGHGGDVCVCLLDPALAAGGVRVRSPLGLGGFV
jgi:hypothetical protein